jgi:predicted phosphodiesterase
MAATAKKSGKTSPRKPISADAGMPDIHFIFRFRDSISRSIEEHQKIIGAHRWCWWGWWKRQSEDSRSDIWDALAKDIARYKKVPVGLFDSNTGNVHRAIVVDVIKPAKGTEDRKSVPDGQSKYVPLYYREGSPSRAWLKIVKIQQTEVDFFGKYSFTEAPKLRNYDGQTVEKFKNKRIMNPDELTGMESTIWRIRPAKDTDTSEEILLTVKGLTKAVSGEVVQCKGDTILHLTDLHFAAGKHRRTHVWRFEGEKDTADHTMVQAITSVLKVREIGLVIISGDFTFIGTQVEFNEAAAAISHLLKILDLTPDNLIIVPGNHDIQWVVNAEYKPEAVVERAPPEATLNYRNFYRDILRHEPDPHLSMGRRFLLPCGMTVEVCAVNSSSLALGKNFLAAMGRIDEAGLGEVANELGWGQEETVALRLLVIHHHLAVTEDLEPAEKYEQGYGLAVDAVRVQRLAARKRVHLALHGHKHRCFIWRSTVYELPERTQQEHRLGELSIVGGGSAGSRETEALSNYFNLLKIKPGILLLEMYRSQNTNIFIPFQTWQADLVLSPESGGLKLGDWRPAIRPTK